MREEFDLFRHPLGQILVVGLRISHSVYRKTSPASLHATTNPASIRPKTSPAPRASGAIPIVAVPFLQGKNLNTVSSTHHFVLLGLLIVGEVGALVGG